MLLTLKMEEQDLNQGIQCTQKTGKSKERSGFYPRISRWSRPCKNLDIGSVKLTLELISDRKSVPIYYLANSQEMEKNLGLKPGFGSNPTRATGNAV